MISDSICFNRDMRRLHHLKHTACLKLDSILEYIICLDDLEAVEFNHETWTSIQDDFNDNITALQEVVWRMEHYTNIYRRQKRVVADGDGNHGGSNNKNMRKEANNG